MPLSVTREEKLHTAARGARRAHVEPHGAALGEFHRVVDQILDRRAQPRRVADQHFGQVGGDRHFGGEAFGLRPCRKRIRQRFDQAPRPERLLLERQRAGIGLGGVDRQRRQRGEMLGAGLDARGPAPLALAEIGARQQFAERQDAGERGADVVRERGERRLGRRVAGPRRGDRRRERFAADFFLDRVRAVFDRTMAAPRAPRVLVAHDLFGKPVSTFPDHAQSQCHGGGPNKTSSGGLFPRSCASGRARPCAGCPARWSRRRAIRAGSWPKSTSTACGHRHRE